MSLLLVLEYVCTPDSVVTLGVDKIAVSATEEAEAELLAPMMRVERKEVFSTTSSSSSSKKELK